jgi:hypothetical protein
MKGMRHLHVGFTPHLIQILLMTDSSVRAGGARGCCTLLLSIQVLIAGAAHAQPMSSIPSPLVASPPQSAQQAPSLPAPARRLRVFLDCFDCFQDYLRDEIRWVDFVRQREDADVHILSSSTSTGGGGREVVLRFVGLGRFQGVDHEHRAITMVADPEEVRRRQILYATTIGLLDYLSHEGLPADLNVTVRTAAAQGKPAVPARDPWNFWVFSIEGGASINAEETSRDSQFNIQASADRVTESWKISIGADFEEERERFDLDEDDPSEFRTHSRGVSVFLARSLGPHWSVGLQGGVDSSSFGNTRVSAGMAPAIEYSVFPYSQYATRQLRIQYEVGPVHARYNEITLFDQLRETRGQHELSVTLEQRQPWGTLDAGFEFSQYLHDPGKYRLEVDGDISIRLFRGFSVSLEGSASRIRDQLSLPRRNATPEEVLLRLRELQSGYELSFDINLNYSFGSLFNNIVNPRFGQ